MLIYLFLLVNEILDNEKLLSNKNSLDRVVSCLRKIGSVSIASANASNDGFHSLLQISKLFEKIATSISPICRKFILVADEFFTLLQQWERETNSNGDDPKMFLLVDFLIEESSRPPDVIRALLLWSSATHFGDSFLPRLERILNSGVHFSSINGELSGTILRMKHARKDFKELAPKNRSKHDDSKANSIWERMATGNVKIKK